MLRTDPLKDPCINMVPDQVQPFNGSTYVGLKYKGTIYIKPLQITVTQYTRGDDFVSFPHFYLIDATPAWAGIVLTKEGPKIET